MATLNPLTLSTTCTSLYQSPTCSDALETPWAPWWVRERLAQHPRPVRMLPPAALRGLWLMVGPDALESLASLKGGQLNWWQKPGDFRIIRERWRGRPPVRLGAARGRGEQGTRMPRGQGGGACESGVCGEEGLLVRGLRRDSRQGDTGRRPLSPWKPRGPVTWRPEGRGAVQSESRGPGTRRPRRRRQVTQNHESQVGREEVGRPLGSRRRARRPGPLRKKPAGFAGGHPSW